MLTLPEKSSTIKKRVREIPLIVNLEDGFRMMDQFGDYVQVLSLPAPPIESLGDPQKSPELAEVANDGLAELVTQHPDRFPGFVAGLPMNNPDAAVKEIERAVLKLSATGVQMHTNPNGPPPADPKLLPLFDQMAELNQPLFGHHNRTPTSP